MEFMTYNQLNRELNYEFPCDDFVCANKIFDDEDKLSLNEQSYNAIETQ